MGNLELGREVNWMFTPPLATCMLIKPSHGLHQMLISGPFIHAGELAGHSADMAASHQAQWAMQFLLVGFACSA